MTMQSSETDELEELYTLVNDVFEINIGEHPARSREEAKERLLKSGEAIQAYIDKHYLSKQRVVEAFKLLEHGHGGGNWRRLVIQAREALGLEEKPE